MYPMTTSPRRSSLAIGLVVPVLLLSQGADGFATHPAASHASYEHGMCTGSLLKTRNIWSRKDTLSTELFVGSSIDPDQQELFNREIEDGAGVQDDKSLLKTKESSPPSALWSMFTGGGPPLQVDDTNLLLYDVFLILNLSASISFWVVHRMSFVYIASSLSEGALLCICWIIAGLTNGAFLYSAVDGHYDPLGENADKGGPKAAGLLGLSTFVGTSSIRVLIALTLAVLQHRPVGSGGEELIPLEILTGLILMSTWRALHSAYTPRI